MAQSYKPFQTAVLPDLEPETRCLIGVSGGKDSMALLHWLHGLGHWKLVVCHLDHALRPASKEDARFVEAEAKALNLPFVSKRVAVTALARRKKQSIETAARNARYDFFGEVAEAHACNHLFLAHHADDQVETFLFNLLRGSGMAGLGGMAVESTRTIRSHDLVLLRPLLPVWRDEIDGYVSKHALSFREDASNTDPRYTRNRIRHSVLPFLTEAMNRDVRRALWRAAEICRADDKCLAEQVPAIEPELSVPALGLLPTAIQRRVIHAWLKSHGVTSIGFEEIESVRSLLETRIARINLPGDKHAFRRSKRIHLSDSSKKS